MLRSWRIVKRSYAKDAFSGEGARLHGGRWNTRGTPLVYTASTQALAALELLAHLESAEMLFHYVVFEVIFEASLVRNIETALPKNWDADPVPNTVRSIGDLWAREARSSILRVPSALLPAEYNYLLDPRHPKFSRIRFGDLTPLRIHNRLIAKLK